MEKQELSSKDCVHYLQVLCTQEQELPDFLTKLQTGPWCGLEVESQHLFFFHLILLDLTATNQALQNQSHNTNSLR